MKTLKKLLVALLALIASFGLISAVSAATDGTITVSGTTEGKTYEIYKIFDLTYSGNNVAYTIDSDWTAFFDETTGLGKNYITTTPNDKPITIGNATKYINITEDNKVEFSEKALKYIADNNLALEANETITAGAGETSITFTGLAYGYYLVYPKGATDIKNNYASICSLTSTMPNADVNVKADYPDITKTTEDVSVETGQLVQFTITGKVPTTTGYDHYIYKISDTWSGGLEKPATDEIEFTVKFGTTVIDAVVPTYTTNGFTLEYDMTQYQTYKGQPITITYKLRVTENAITQTTKNTAKLEYSNNPKNYEETVETPDKEVQLYSSEIIIDKYDAADATKATKLAGAEFILSKVDENGATVYYQAVSGTTIITSTTTDKIYTTTGLTKVNWVSDKNAATVLTTNSDGVIEFKGIENGNYSLTETKAPEGFNLLPTSKDVVVQPTDDDTTLSVSLVSEIANNSGTELPSTGGMGTTLFIVLGSLLTIGSAIIFITNKRISKEF